MNSKMITEVTIPKEESDFKRREIVIYDCTQPANKLFSLDQNHVNLGLVISV